MRTFWSFVWFSAQGLFLLCCHLVATIPVIEVQPVPAQGKPDLLRPEQVTFKPANDSSELDKKLIQLEPSGQNSMSLPVPTGDNQIETLQKAEVNTENKFKDDNLGKENSGKNLGSILDTDVQKLNSTTVKDQVLINSSLKTEADDKSFDQKHAPSIKIQGSSPENVSRQPEVTSPKQRTQGVVDDKGFLIMVEKPNQDQSEGKSANNNPAQIDRHVTERLGENENVKKPVGENSSYYSGDMFPVEYIVVVTCLSLIFILLIWRRFWYTVCSSLGFPRWRTESGSGRYKASYRPL